MGKKMDARKYIKIRGANENNLKNIDLDIPRIYGITLLLRKAISGPDGKA